MCHVLKHPNVRSVGNARRFDDGFSFLRDGRVNTIIIDPLFEAHPDFRRTGENLDEVIMNRSRLSGTFDPCSTAVKAAAKFITRVRREFPHVVFVVHATKSEFAALCKTDLRFEHYIFIENCVDGHEFEQLFRRALARCVEWHSGLFEYDIAISFAGEDRETARELASALKSLGARVFFDEYEQLALLGKNLYTHLHQVYSQTARYCVLLVSKAYVSKLWTSHERQAAQERAFKQGMIEYILPIRLDDTRSRV